jgi:hypothetical protein
VSVNARAALTGVPTARFRASPADSSMRWHPRNSFAGAMKDDSFRIRSQVMNRKLPACMGIVLGAAIAGLPRTEAGLCFCWEDNASRSDCNAAIASEADCQQHCTSLGYVRHFFEDSGTPACEGTDAAGGGVGPLPVIREPDVDDADGDGDVTQTVRWRYVMVIDDCEKVGDVCREKHRLFKCWCDDDHI